MLILSFCAIIPAQENPYPWQQPQAQVVETGDLKWAPRPFEYEAGEVVRYIDYENGDDSADGQSTSTAWKHHPWDSRAQGQAKAFSGIATYVFKGGVHYRFTAEAGDPAWTAEESGEEGNPIRLTSSPDWGDGEAVIAGSQPITGSWQKATADDVPARMDVSEQTVWFLDLEAPDHPGGRGKMEVVLFEVQPSGEINNLYLASDVGWEPQNPNFALHHWNTWDEYRQMGKRGGGYQDDALKGFDPDYFEGGTVWSQYAWVIANPTPDDKPIGKGDYDPDKGTLRYKDGKEPVNPGTRYLVENLPQFLDQPGEYYYDTAAGRLFVRMPEDRDPNQSRIEMSTALEILRVSGQSCIEISGLTFRYNGRRKGRFFEDSHVIVGEGNIKALTVENCKFEFIANDCIKVSNKANEQMGHIRIADCDFYWINGGTCVEVTANTTKDVEVPKDGYPGRIDFVEILRNRARNIGLYRHDDHRWSNVQALNCDFATRLHMAGNIVDSTWGSGLVAQGGMGGKGTRGFDFPLSRFLIHHNKTENNALAVNDYGGMSLWQHGVIYAYNNIVGNSVGYWPGGFFNRGGGGLSYPIYLDGGFKIYVFNNITWAHPFDKETPYSSNTPAFFNVFGFMNPFVNNTVYGNGEGLGGTSGNRNDYLGNLFADINKTFIDVNHGGNPSLIGGDDDASTGIDGATTLAYGHNLFHGKAKAGVIASKKRGATKDVEAKDLQTLQEQMEAYPMRYAHLGQATDSFPLEKGLSGDQAKPTAGDLDFRPKSGSPAIDAGVRYFVPWALFGVVGEWDFNANHANPQMVLDYHYYPTIAHFNRSMYHLVPAYELELNATSLEDYIASTSESWNAGALVFDGSRFGKVPDAGMKSDIVLPIKELNPKALDGRQPFAPWETRDNAYVLPAQHRTTLDMAANNLLMEAILKVEPGTTNAVIAGKHDGETGYRLLIDEQGRVVFQVSAAGQHGSVASSMPINSGEWGHVIAEVDRATGKMRLYLNGKPNAEADSGLDPSAGLSNSADFLVGTDAEKGAFFQGALDFLRVSRGTLADAKTDIEELYAWQFNGPAKYDFAGKAPVDQRDIGALER